MKRSIPVLVMLVFVVAGLSAGGAQEEVAEGVPEISVLCDPVIWTKQNTDINDSVEMAAWEEIAGVELEYVTPPHDQYSEKLNLMFASGDVPDVVFMMMEINSQVDIFGKIKEGYFVPLDEYLDSELGQRLLAREDISYWERWTVDGQRWAIPYIWNLSANLGTMVRQDWLDNLGLDPPETLEEYREVLNAFTYDDPDGNGVDDTYGFTFRQDMSWFHTFYGYFGLSEWTNNAAHHVFVVEDGVVEYEALLPRYKEYVSFISELYADGVFAPGNLVKSSSDWKADIFGSKAGMWSHQSTRIDSYFMLNMIKANPDWEDQGIELSITSPPRNPETGLGGCPQPYPGDYGLFITTQAEDPEVVFNYIADTFVSDEAAEFAKYGLEGEHHRVVDGQKQRIDTGDITPYLMLKAVVYTDERFPIDDDDATFLYGERGLEAYKFNLENAPMSQTTWFGAPTFQSELENPDLKDIVREYTLKMVSGAIGIDTGFEQMEEELYQNNLADVLAERQEWYDANY